MVIKNFLRFWFFFGWDMFLRGWILKNVCKKVENPCWPSRNNLIKNWNGEAEWRTGENLNWHAATTAAMPVWVASPRRQSTSSLTRTCTYSHFFFLSYESANFSIARRLNDQLLPGWLLKQKQKFHLNGNLLKEKK